MGRTDKWKVKRFSHELMDESVDGSNGVNEKLVL